MRWMLSLWAFSCSLDFWICDYSNWERGFAFGSTKREAASVILWLSEDTVAPQTEGAPCFPYQRHLLPKNDFKNHCHWANYSSSMLIFLSWNGTPWSWNPIKPFAGRSLRPVFSICMSWIFSPLSQTCRWLPTHLIVILFHCWAGFAMFFAGGPVMMTPPQSWCVSLPLLPCESRIWISMPVFTGFATSATRK